MNVRMLLRLSLLVIPLLVAPSGMCKAKSNNGINSAEDLLRPPRIRNVSMSPDGKYVAGLAPIGGMNGNTGLVVIDLETMNIIRSFNWLDGYDIYQYSWLSNEVIAFNVSKWDSFAAGMYSTSIHSKEVRPLVKDDAVVELIDPNTSHATDAWVWVKDGWNIKPSLARLDKTGSAEGRMGQDVRPTHENPLLTDHILEPPGDVYWWYVDWDHVPRLVKRFYDEKLQYLHRDRAGSEWEPLPLDPEDWEIALFSPDNRKLYVTGYNGHDTKGLYLYDIDTDSLSEPLFRDDYYDFSDTARFMTYKKDLLGIRYHRSAPSIVWFSSQMKLVQKMIDDARPDTVNIIDGWSEDFMRHLVTSYSDTSPPTYSLLDLKSKSLNEVHKAAPWLNESLLAKTEVLHFQTTDGLRLESYLTRPTTGQAPFPMVCLVHGGPWARDFRTYHDETQFLASRGYAVLKINFRGSTGYGKRISADPEFEFRKMHDDITTGVKTVVKAGIADPERLAIMGASFGGYAAMCGAAFEPDLYQCAITNMGVFDWEEMIRERKRQRSRYAHKKWVDELGDPDSGQIDFSEISPIYHIENVRVPILVIHGKKDRNVPIRQSKELVSALRSAKVEHETIFLGGEGHNIFDFKRRKETYEKIADFLDQNLALHSRN